MQAERRPSWLMLHYRAGARDRRSRVAGEILDRLRIGDAIFAASRASRRLPFW